MIRPMLVSRSGKGRGTAIYESSYHRRRRCDTLLLKRSSNCPDVPCQLAAASLLHHSIRPMCSISMWCVSWLQQAEVFEEVPNMDFPFEGIPTVPLRKDMDHMVS